MIQPASLRRSGNCCARFSSGHIEPDRRIRARAGRPDCVGYRVQKSLFCDGRPPAAEHPGLPGRDMSPWKARNHCRTARRSSLLARSALLGCKHTGLPDGSGPWGLSSGRRGVRLRMGASGGGGGDAAAAGQLAVREHGRGGGGQGGPGRDQGDLPARHAAGADHLDGGGTDRRDGDGAPVADRDRVRERGRGGERLMPAGRRRPRPGPWPAGPGVRQPSRRPASAEIAGGGNAACS